MVKSNRKIPTNSRRGYQTWLQSDARRLIKKAAKQISVDSKNLSGQTAYEKAVHDNRFSTAEILRSLGADISSALYSSIKNENQSALAYFKNTVKVDINPPYLTNKMMQLMSNDMNKVYQKNRI